MRLVNCPQCGFNFGETANEEISWRDFIDESDSMRPVDDRVQPEPKPVTDPIPDSGTFGIAYYDSKSYTFVHPSGEREPASLVHRNPDSLTLEFRGGVVLTFPFADNHSLPVPEDEL